MITIVTSLYDINRKDMDGRSYGEYLDWFSKTLKIKCNMVIFVDGKDVDFVKSQRKDFNTKIIEKSLCEMPIFAYKQQMDNILSSDVFKNTIKDSNRIECKHSMYNIVQYSKFDWMEEAATKNFFNSEYFIWMDAGLSRFFYDMNLNNHYPSDSKKNELLNHKDKILLQIFKNSYPDLFFAKDLNFNYLKDNRSYVMGGMFGGGVNAIKKINVMVKKILHDMINEQFMNNEQIVLGYLLKKDNSLFQCIVNDSMIHRNYEIINYLAK